MVRRIISIRLDEETGTDLDIAAKANLVSRTAFVEAVLREFFKKDPTTQKRVIHPRSSRFRDKDPEPANPEAPICC
jgi:metal-responsive CopG/Arc/MetJ family transcriptional regulator